MNTLATPSSSSNRPKNSSSGVAPRTYVPGPPTDWPTENFVAFGFGVGSTRIAMSGRA